MPVALDDDTRVVVAAVGADHLPVARVLGSREIGLETARQHIEVATAGAAPPDVHHIKMQRSLAIPVQKAHPTGLRHLEVWAEVGADANHDRVVRARRVGHGTGVEVEANAKRGGTRLEALDPDGIDVACRERRFEVDICRGAENASAVLSRGIDDAASVHLVAPVTRIAAGRRREQRHAHDQTSTGTTRHAVTVAAGNGPRSAAKGEFGPNLALRLRCAGLRGNGGTMTIAELWTPFAVAWGAFEFVLVVGKRAKGRQVQRRDGGSLGVLWAAIAVSLTAGIWLGVAGVGSMGEVSHSLVWVGLVLMVLGLAVRVAAIVALKQFFTVDVAVHADHTLVRRGPYRLVRHPSYTGILILVAGLGLALGSWASVIALVLPISAALLYRIGGEERALADTLGEEYLAYARSTRRLIPFLY